MTEKETAQNRLENHAKTSFEAMDPGQILEKMTLQEKAQLVCGANFWQSAQIDRLHIPAIRFSDGPYGLRRQMDKNDHLGISPSVPAACFPSASALACSWNPELCFEIGKALGREAKSLDVDVLLGPVANLIENPMGGRNFEMWSEDPFLSGLMAAAMTEGIEQHVQACLKHFDVNGREKFRQAADERVAPAVLKRLYQPAFRHIVQSARPGWVMSAYNRLNGTFCSENTSLLQNTLRNDWGFKGTVISDWGGCSDLAASLKAGLNLEMPSTGFQSQQEILEAVESGLLDEDVLDARVLEMLQSIQKIQKNRARPNEPWDAPKHHALALKAAQQSIVLLKNEHHLLPLSRKTRTLWIGPFGPGLAIQGVGSASVISAIDENFPELLHRYAPEAIWKQGYSLDMDERENQRLAREALSAAKDADAIVFLCQLHPQENMEGLDRRAVHIPHQALVLLEELFPLGIPVVAAAVTASALGMDWDGQADAVIRLGLAGEGAREALIRTIMGESEPQGALAQTIAYLWSDHPTSMRFHDTSLQHIHSEGMQIGYRYFSQEHVQVRYPFGYGLSYGDLKLADARPDEDGVAFTMENHGGYGGSHPVQLYVQLLPGKKAFEPAEGSGITSKELELYQTRELKGFVRIHVDAGSRKEGYLPFDRDTFTVWIPKEMHDPISEDGTYRFRIFLGMDAADESWCFECFIPAEQCSVIQAGLLKIEQAIHMTDPFHTPIELFENTRSRLFGNMIARLKGMRQRSLQKKKPNLAAAAVLDMTPCSIAKTWSQYISMEMARDLADYLASPQAGKWLELVRHYRAFTRRKRQWNRQMHQKMRTAEE